VRVKDGCLPSLDASLVTTLKTASIATLRAGQAAPRRAPSSKTNDEQL
jgi:hypothetical protein